MKAYVFAVNGDRKTQIDLPIQFKEPLRDDLIRRAVHALQANRRQAYGADPRAGTKQGYATPKRRRKYKTTYGYGISRIKRKHTWHRGRQFGWVGAFVANAVSGRKAFPPLAWKNWSQKINKKENRKAIRSAIAATSTKELVEARGHSIDKIPTFPIIIEDKFEDLKKTKEVKQALKKIKLEPEMKRTSKRKVRAGKGKMRGRKYRTKVGPLVIVSRNCDIEKSGSNVLGLDICTVNALNAELLAPGAQPGRLTIWTKSAIDKLAKEEMFL